MTTRFAFLVPLVASVVACSGTANEEPEIEIQPPPPSLELQAELLPTVLPVDGSVRARHRAEISTRLMARITATPVDVGSLVAEGQVVMRLGTEDVAAKRTGAEAAVTAAQLTWEEAVRQAARMDTLFAQDAVARIQRDHAQLARAQAESQLAMARAAVHDVATAESYSTVRAPFAGAVVARHVDEGDLASPGLPLLIIESAGPRDAVFGVPADVGAALAADDRISVTGPDAQSLSARIRAVSPGADAMTRTVEVRAVLPADWPTGIAVIGLFPAGTHAGIAIPSSAVVRRGQLTGVRVVGEHGVGIRWVRLGRTIAAAPEGDDTGELRIEVLSGLEPGERILR
jgi:RND family efflux transporter MFP subunit